MKQGKITIADLHILALSEIAQCYNDLKSRIRSADYGDGENDIIHRDRVDKWLMRFNIIPIPIMPFHL